MKTLGMLTTALAVAGIAGGAFLFVRSLPEVRRYLHIRNM
jgi:hypothetical protein